ncbi:MAG: asparaginase [Zetaproteobacteria bacterium]|nr:asparaginase [Pseudobdellovibrionaceae bacterium]
MEHRICVVTTGGTIDKIYFDSLSEFQVGDPQIKEVLKNSNADLNWRLISVLKKDSLEITEQDRDQLQEIISKIPEKRVIITHGTDTMTQSAAKLSGISDKTIVFTGAMEPAKIKNSDASFNIGCAIAAVQCLPQGVYITMNGQIFEADKVSKNRDTMRFEALPKED